MTLRLELGDNTEAVKEKSMRRYAILKEAVKVNKYDYIYKIMLYQNKRDVYLFKYYSKDAVFSSSDEWYSDVESLCEEWDELIDENGWIDMEDPLPDCQHDTFLPIRVKGRDKGDPKWGCYEIFENGQWKDYYK